MDRRAAVAIAGFAGALLALGAMASCGSRTGLPGEEAADASPDRAMAHPDTSPREETKEEPKPREKDVAVEEALPGIDVNADVPVFNPCPDAGATLIYVIGKSNTLYSFDPSLATFRTIGTIACPGAGTLSEPFSMAVDREGVAYVIFEFTATGSASALYRVSTKDASCTSTSFNPAAYGNFTFGMGFVANEADGGSDAGETLYVSRDVMGLTGDGELDRIDTTTFVLTPIADFSPFAAAAELTGTGAGSLFAFSPSTTAGESFIAQVDPKTAKVLGQDFLPGIVQGEGWAFGYWGGNFYTFTTGMGDPATVVNQFDPVSKTVTLITTLATDTIVGAGVSTCAPVGIP